MKSENHFLKNQIKKIRKKTENQCQNAACEQKTTTEKPNFCSNTVFSLYFKIRARKIHAAKPLAFSLHFLFRRDQNHYSNLTSKIMKMCEQILKKKKKRQRPNTIQILWIVKNRSAIIAGWEDEAAIKNYNNSFLQFSALFFSQFLSTLNCFWWQNWSILTKRKCQWCQVTCYCFLAFSTQTVPTIEVLFIDSNFFLQFAL